MFQITNFNLEFIKQPILDLDITHSNSWVGVTGYLENVDRRRNVNIPFGTHIWIDEKSIELSKEIRFPTVRSISNEKVLILGMNKQYTEVGQNNAWIFNSNGEVVAEFSTDSAVEDVLVTEDFIIITYFDEAACYGEGLEIYDFGGKFLYGYEDYFGKDSAEIMDCYAASVVRRNEILFCPYTEFPLVLLDLENKTQKILEIPDEAKAFHSITTFDEKFYFHLKYKLKLEGYDFGIYEWEIGSKKVNKVFEYENYFTRGLPNGKFFAKTDFGYSIISLK